MAVAYDATGAGNTTFSAVASPDTITETHTFVSASSNLIVVWLWWQTTGTASLSGVTRTCTVGGQSATLAGTMTCDNNSSVDFNMALDLFYLENPPTSPLAQTVSATLTGSGMTFEAALDSVSYTGVGGVGTAVTNFGASTSLSSGAVSSATGHMVAQGFVGNGAAAIASYSGTSRFSNFSSGNYGINFGDAAGASSVTITASETSTDTWASVALDMVPAAAAPSGGPTGVIIPNPFVGPMALRNKKHMPYVPYRMASGSQAYSDGANSTWTFTTATDGHRGITDGANQTITFLGAGGGVVQSAGVMPPLQIPNPFVGPMALRHRKRPPYVASQRQGYTDGANQTIVFTTATNGHRNITDGANSTWTFNTSTNGHRGITDGANQTIVFTTSTNGHRGISDGANQAIVFGTSTNGHRGITDGANATIVFGSAQDGFVDRPRFVPLAIPNPFVGPMALRNRKRMPYRGYRTASGPQTIFDGANSTWVFNTSTDGHRGITDGANSVWTFTTSTNGHRGISDGANVTVTFTVTGGGFVQPCFSYKPTLIANPFVGPMAQRRVKRMPYVPSRRASFFDAANQTVTFTAPVTGVRGVVDGANVTIAFNSVVAGQRRITDHANLAITVTTTAAGKRAIRDGANLILVVSTSTDGTNVPFLIDVEGTVVVGPNEIRSVTIPAEIFNVIVNQLNMSAVVEPDAFTVVVESPTGPDVV